MGLDIRQDETFQRREWRLERIGWAVVGLFVLAGLTGLLGTGPLSWARDAAGPVTVEYDRVTHLEADESVTFVFGPDAVSAGTLTAELTGSWPAAVEIDVVTPEPAEQRVLPGGLVLEFPVGEPGELEVTVAFRAQRIGPTEGTLAVGDDAVVFSQLVLP